MTEAVDQDRQRYVTAFLAQPETHGLDAGETIERIDTHSAFVFLAGEALYKVKRAVYYPYMDCSSLALRRRACERERPQPPHRTRPLPRYGARNPATGQVARPRRWFWNI